MWPRLLVPNSSVVGLVMIPCRNGGDCSTQVKMLVILIRVSFGIYVSHSLIPQQLYVLGMNFHLCFLIFQSGVMGPASWAHYLSLAD